MSMSEPEKFPWPEFFTRPKPIEGLDDYPLLKASLEDAAAVAAIVGSRFGTPRHAVCLMHDAIEFAIYERLVLSDQDIYADGQHTIGLDRAMNKCAALNIEVPLIGTVRTIQKHRGDAKHHAQTPNENLFSRMVAEFRIIISRFVHEQFGPALGSKLTQIDLLPYDSALYQCHRKYRNHNDAQALRFGIGCLIQRERLVTGRPVDFAASKETNPQLLVTILERSLETTDFSLAPASLAQTIRQVPAQLRNRISRKELAEAADEAGKAYALVDGIGPSVFEIKKARKLTEQLFQPSQLLIHGAMSWCKWQMGDTPRMRELSGGLSKLLRANPEVVKSFGPPYEMDDDEREWKWWEFAVFDGERWHTFHLDDRFAVSLEAEGIETDQPRRRERAMERIFQEFSEVCKGHIGYQGSE
jgi:hypothetical protein